MSRVKCPKCTSEIRVTEKTSGRKVKCTCGTVLRMPQISAAASVVNASAGQPPIRFECPSCHQTLQVKSEFAGKVSQCNCGTKIRIPNPGATAKSTGVSQADPFAGAAAANNDPFGNTDPFANTGQDDFMSAASGGANHADGQPVTAPQYRKPKKVGPKRVVRKRAPEKVKHGGGISINGEIIGGVLAMVGAVVWFTAGLFAGYIFFYPPVLFFIGLAGVIKGVLGD